MIFMKYRFTTIAYLLVAVTAALGQSTPDGISKRNLANADLALMDNHDPKVEKANFKLLDRVTLSDQRLSRSSLHVK